MDIVVLAAQAHQQHAARIGVFGDGGQQLLRHPVVVPQLGAAGIVRKRENTVAGIAEFHGGQFCQHIRRVVGAGNRGNNPDFIAHPHRAVFAAVALERWSRWGGRQARQAPRSRRGHRSRHSRRGHRSRHSRRGRRARHSRRGHRSRHSRRGHCSRRPLLSRPHAVRRAVLIFQRALQVGAHIVGVHPGACAHPLCGVSDGITVLNHVLARLQIRQSHLVASGNHLRGRAAAARELNLTTGLKLLQRDGHIILLMNSKISGLQRITAFISPINRPASAKMASRDGRLKHSNEQ